MKLKNSALKSHNNLQVWKTYVVMWTLTVLGRLLEGISEKGTKIN
jgi:hypothetical protein